MNIDNFIKELESPLRVGSGPMYFLVVYRFHGATSRNGRQRSAQHGRGNGARLHRYHRGEHVREWFNHCA